MQAIVGGMVAFAIVVGWVLVRWQATGRDPSYLMIPPSSCRHRPRE